jgi:hypothetical protein
MKLTSNNEECLSSGLSKGASVFQRKPKNINKKILNDKENMVFFQKFKDVKFTIFKLSQPGTKNKNITPTTFKTPNKLVFVKDKTTNNAHKTGNVIFICFFVNNISIN